MAAFTVLFCTLLTPRPGLASKEECRQVEECCTAIYESMQESGNTVPGFDQCDTSYLVEQFLSRNPNMPICFELMGYYGDFAHNLFDSGAIMAVPPECMQYVDPYTLESEPPPFTMESGTPEPGDDDWTMESDPGGPDEEDDWSIEPGSESPDGE